MELKVYVICVTPAIRRQRHEFTFQVCLDYTVRPCFTPFQTKEELKFRAFRPYKKESVLFP